MEQKRFQEISNPNPKITNDPKIQVLQKDSETVTGSKIIPDITGKPGIQITFKTQRDLYNQGLQNIQFFVIVFGFGFLIILLLLFLFLDRSVIKRVKALNTFVHNVGENKNIESRIDFPGNDEISNLASSTNQMLTKLEAAYKELYFLSYTDKLTGLKNRAYLEKVLQNLDRSSESHYGIVMGDLNGLKYTNDSYGHYTGDQLLREIAAVFQECCSPTDEIARWGGDEFLILIKDKGPKYCDELIKNIKTKCKERTGLPIQLSIALGNAANDGTLKSKDIIKKAEERMYQNKLLESCSIRNSTLLSLQRTLYEKDQETEEHAERLKTICLKMGEAIGFSQHELDELALFAMLHDIGKIAIPDHILMKPGRLTEEEWLIMKTHPEVGYRIAMSTPQLAHIADNILSHHERFDGKGYPRGLKGEEIPMMARILTIVDSFDVMTHTRPYKQAMSVSEAVEELKACSGKQFDPLMVQLFLELQIKDTPEGQDVLAS